LISADNLLHEAAGRHGAWVEANSGDYNLDARQELQLANDKLFALVAPARGGMLYELDVRSICHNLLATLSRRPEAYHHKVLAGAAQSSDQHVASIHEQVIFKQPDLDQRLQYDVYPRKSLIDHFYDPAVDLGAVFGGHAQERGDFVGGVFESRIRRGHDRVQVVLNRNGHIGDHPIQLTKTITLEAGSSELEIGYLLENLPTDEVVHFAPEFNFSGLPAGADDRYFFDVQQQRLGQLGTRLDLVDADGLGMADEWLGIGVMLRASRPTRFWTFPIETVSQSEGGFELVHQSVVAIPHWIIEPTSDRRFAVTLRLAIDTSQAESRHPNRRAEVVTS
jgi:alpha-amylase